VAGINLTVGADGGGCGPAKHKPHLSRSRTTSVAGPTRFRRATDRWHRDRVRDALYAPLDGRLGADLDGPWFAPPAGHDARRLEMDNGDLALFAWAEDGSGAWWLGNTETPKTLWKTEKYSFEEAPNEVAEWVQRELLATLELEDPWLAGYETLSWFFLPVLFSKDGRESTRRFFAEDAAGFPDAGRDEGLTFYDDLLTRGLLDDYRYTMATKLGTSQQFDLTRMRATMGEFNAAKLLADADHDLAPEVELDSGHALDFRVDGHTLVEVTRPQPPGDRRAGTPTAALRETVDAKTSDQLRAHEGAVLLVDCTSFRDGEWSAVRDEQPAVGYEPTVVYRYRPGGSVAGYTCGSVPLEVADLL